MGTGQAALGGRDWRRSCSSAGELALMSGAEHRARMYLLSRRVSLMHPPRSASRPLPPATRRRSRGAVTRESARAAPAGPALSAARRLHGAAAKGCTRAPAALQTTPAVLAEAVWPGRCRHARDGAVTPCGGDAPAWPVSWGDRGARWCSEWWRPGPAAARVRQGELKRRPTSAGPPEPPVRRYLTRPGSGTAV